MKAYYHALDENKKDCLVAKVSSDEYEIIHECLSGFIKSIFSATGAKEAGFETIKLAGKQVQAKESTVRRYQAKLRQRLQKFDMFSTKGI